MQKQPCDEYTGTTWKILIHKSFLLFPYNLNLHLSQFVKHRANTWIPWMRTV